MKCKIICDLLPLYIDDVCSDETREAVEQHLKTCPGCRMEYDKMKADISIDKAEDLDEKKIMEKGRKTMTEYVKEKLYRKVILGDTLLNLMIIICICIYGLNRGEDVYIFGELLHAPAAFVVMSFFSDIIYWVMYFMKRQPVAVEAICKMSVFMKIALLFFVVAGAAVVGFCTIIKNVL